jgi:hypothetical protein
MKTLFSSALALTTLGATALAAPDPAPSSESDWARLDREIGELTASLGRPQSGTNVGGLVRTYYARSSDDAFEQGPVGASVNSGNMNHLGAFLLKDVDLFAEGSVAEYDWRINVDFDDGDAWLEDAYGRYNIGGGFNLVVGQFKAPTTRSASIHPENLVLPDRTYLGQILDFWDPGAMVTGDWKHFGAFASVQNGADGNIDHHIYAGRLEYRLGGGAGRVEGAFGAPTGCAGSFGAFGLAERSDFSTGHLYGADGSFTSGPFAAHAEVAHVEGELLSDGTNSKTLGDDTTPGFDFFGATMLPLNYAEAGNVEDVTLWNTTLSFLIEAIDVELVGRFELYDDPGNTRSATVGANWYRSGKNAVWHAGVTQIRSNDPQAQPSAVNGVAEGVGDATLFQVGLSLGMSTANL